MLCFILEVILKILVKTIRLYNFYYAMLYFKGNFENPGKNNHEYVYTFNILQYKSLYKSNFYLYSSK